MSPEEAQKNRERAAAWYAANRDRALERDAKRYRDDPEFRKAKIENARRWVEGNPDKAKANRTRYSVANRSKKNQDAVTARRRDPARALFDSAKSRARRSGVPFTITVDDVVVPTVCPVLAIPLVMGGNGRFHANSPSIDRVIPALGYVPGNIRVISMRANRIKCDATREELLAVALWLHRTVGEVIQ
ncbi:MAG: hypothetical protein ACT6QM_05895 [Brevundimonas mediterranea]|uniref:hypothetical protein n=1 Tax=Brevundimonas mediterranea TaxID=74329 RepID=UPI004033E663